MSKTRQWKPTILREIKVEPMQDLWSEDCIEDTENEVPDRKSRGGGLRDANQKT